MLIFATRLYVDKWKRKVACASSKSHLWT